MTNNQTRAKRKITLGNERIDRYVYFLEDLVQSGYIDNVNFDEVLQTVQRKDLSTRTLDAYCNEIGAAHGIDPISYSY